VGWPQIVFGIGLVGALVGLSLYYAVRQVSALQHLKANPALPEEEKRYERRKAYRRLVGCGLMLALGGMLTFVHVYLENPAQQLADERNQFAPGEAPPLTPEQRSFLRLWGGYWIAILLTLLAVVIVAALDLWATRRYGIRQYRKLQADRRAMIERQVSRLRQQRNGHV
jgi:hypothetical protein